MNGDGRLDSIGATSFGTVAISFGNSDGAFQIPLNSQPINVFPNRPRGADAADFNQDGNPDVVALSNTGSPFGSGPTIFMGNGDGTIQPASVFLNAGSDELTLVLAGDFNEDGLPDVFAADRNRGDESFALIYLQTPPTTCLPDVNGDGVLTPADFTAWIAAFNAGDLAADQNQDGLLTPTDFTAWIANFNAGC